MHYIIMGLKVHFTYLIPEIKCNPSMQNLPALFLNMFGAVVILIFVCL